MIALVLIAAAQAVSMDSPPLLSFSAHPELRQVTTQVDVGFLATKSSPKHYWFRKTVKPDNGQVVEVRWADTRTCAAGRSVLEDLAKMEPPRPHIWGLDGDDDIIVTADGITYRLDTETTLPNGRMTVRTNIGTPLARWMDAAFAKLEGCWTATPPNRDS